jgi:FUS-interacting serine-arginine-rich protein 1
MARGDIPGPPPGRRDGRRRDEGPPGVSLLIRNVSPDITTQDLQTAFGRIGEIRDVYIPRDYHSHQPKGFAFIEYATPALAAEARDEMNRFIIKGRELEVVFAQERRKTPNEMRGRVVNQQNHVGSSSSPGGGGGAGERQQRSSSFERAQRRDRDRPDEPVNGNANKED